MFSLQKYVPNFKVIKMFVFAYGTVLITINRAPNSQETVTFSPENKIILQKYGVQINSRQIRY